MDKKLLDECGDIWPLRYFGELKHKTGGAVLLFPRGGYYWAYYEDAFNVARVCAVELARSDGGNGHYVASIPCESLDGCRTALATAGLKVAVCDDEEVRRLIGEPKAAKSFEQECEEGWFEFRPDRSFEERCEIVRRTAITPGMTYDERLGAQKRRYGL